MGKVIRNSLFGLIGILVIWQLYFVFASVFVKLLLHTGLFNKLLFKIGFVISIIVIIIGFIYGIKAASKNTLFYKIFLPNNQNLLAALILAVLLLTYASLAKGGSLHLFLGFQIIISSILFYPFAALGLYAYNNWDNKPIKQYKTVIVLVLIVLSPVALVIGTSMHSKFSQGKFYQGNTFSYNHNFAYNKFPNHGFAYNKFPHKGFSYNKFPNKLVAGCGAYVYGFPEQSPAQEAGMQIGEIITEINGQEIKTPRDIKDITYPLIEETEITIVTNNNTYKLTTYFDEIKGKQRAGINVWQQTCGKKTYKKFR